MARALIQETDKSQPTRIDLSQYPSNFIVKRTIENGVATSLKIHTTDVRAVNAMLELSRAHGADIHLLKDTQGGVAASTLENGRESSDNTPDGAYIWYDDLLTSNIAVIYDESLLKS